MSLHINAINSFKWSFFSEIVTKLITPIVFLIMAKFLEPKDFGLVTVGTIVVSFSQIFWDSGLSKVLIQKQENVEEYSNIVFWINSIMGIFLYLVFFMFSDYIGTYFNDQRTSLIVKIVGVQIILSSVSSVHSALLQKDFLFKKLFIIRFFTTALPGLISIALAWQGYGFWSLIISMIFGQMLQSILLWTYSTFRPRLYFSWEQARNIFHFGTWAILGGTLSWAYLWMDSVVVGGNLSSDELGIYRTGNSLVSMAFNFFFGPLLPVLYSTFSLLQFDKKRVSDIGLTALKISSLVALPIAVGIFVFHQNLENVLFSKKWIGIGKVIGVFGFIHGVPWIVGFTGEAYRAINRPDIPTKITLTFLVIYVVTFLYAISSGIQIFLIFRLLLSIVVTVISIVIFCSYFKLPAGEVSAAILQPLLASATAALIPIYLLKSNSELMFAVSMILYALIASLILYPLNKNLIKQIIQIKREGLKYES